MCTKMLHFSFKKTLTPTLVKRLTFVLTVILEYYNFDIYKIILEPSTTPLSYCGFGTIKCSNLQYDIRTHTGEKLYHCLHCDCRAISSSTLRKHINSHTTQKH
ncbi:ZNF711 [Cordylochernes scorpioides]|uniref:ZNF711 n=1 Tax=Cordylochernes scorpioides TaxID=51811 RepID=A0ABY6L1U6_9ARAC|nr:ZNF711 [Cordylochernes scorpioides]